VRGEGEEEGEREMREGRDTVCEGGVFNTTTFLIFRRDTGNDDAYKMWVVICY